MGVDDAELPVVAPVVGRRQLRHRLLRVRALAQQREPVRAVTGVRVCLRGDRTGLRLSPRDDGADGEELRLRRDAPLARLEVAGGDRVRRDDRLTHT